MRYREKRWFRLIAVPAASCFLLATAGCLMPDLVVSNHSGATDQTDPSSPKYRIRFAIRNIGAAPSGETLAYVNAIDSDPPAGQNKIRIQRSASVAPLAPGAATTSLEVTFDLAEMHAKEIDRITIIADPKQMVRESDEAHNIASWTWP